MLVPLMIMIIVIAALAATGYQGLLFTDVDLHVSENRFHETVLQCDDCHLLGQLYLLLGEKEFDGTSLVRELNHDSTAADEYEIMLMEDGTVRIENLNCGQQYYGAVIEKIEIQNRSYYLLRSRTVGFTAAHFEVPSVYDFRVSDITADSAALTWIFPLHYCQNADGSEVTYQFELLDHDSGQLLVMVDNDNNTVISGLAPYRQYHLDLAITACADGRQYRTIHDDLIVFRTLPHALEDVKATSHGKNRIDVSWKAYEGDHDVAYSVYVSAKKDGDYKLLADNIRETRVSEKGLKPNTVRYYYVTASISDNGETSTSSPSAPVSARTEKNRKKSSSPYYPTGATGNPSSSSKLSQARAVARRIARSIHGSSDYDKISQAAYIVSQYCARGRYTTSGSDYSTAYGVFIKGEYSCAGATRALGMVLEYMGYSWKHAHKNQWHHQWCIVTMDGKKGWADGQLGMAGFGKHPAD